MDRYKDFYYILGVTKESSLEDIKKAYRKLSLKFHPDKNEGDIFFAERFKEIQRAYEILSDNTARQAYDKQYSHNFDSSNNFNNSNFLPEIVYFNANKNYFEYDEEITFQWKTINSNKVSIKPFGAVSPIGQKTYKIRDFKNESLKFELIAENTNIERKASKVLHLSNSTYRELYNFFRLKIQSESNTKNTHQFKHKEQSTAERRITYQTDKGPVQVLPNHNYVHPTYGEKAYLNGQPAPDGKYKFGFLWYVHISQGVITKFSFF